MEAALPPRPEGRGTRARNLMDIYKTIGNTPLVKLSRLAQSVFVKLESFNLSGSVKDRAALFMIKDAKNRGLLVKGGLIVEPTSGNTGIALSAICAAEGFRLILTMPESMSQERIRLMRFYGAKVVLTPKGLGMQGAVDEAERIAKIEGGHILHQFDNPFNPEAHRQTTALEIIRDCPAPIDFFVAGVGTGGTITGTGEVLKAHYPDITVVAIEPKYSAVLSGEKKGAHGIQGIGAGFIPSILNRGIIDLIMHPSDEEAMQTARDLAEREGLSVGISSGAAVWAALQLSKQHLGKTIVAICPDGAERYLSTGVKGNL